MGNVFCCACSCQEQDEIGNTMLELEGWQHVDDLIVYIDQLMSKISTRSHEEFGKPNSVASYINTGGNIIDKLSKRLTGHVCKKCLLSALDQQASKVVIKLLDRENHMECVGIALSITVHLLERAASSNEGESLHNLLYMCVLAKNTKNINIYLEGGKLGDILSFIIKAAVICSPQKDPENFCRFVFARLDAVDLENLKRRLVYFYPDLEHQALTVVFNTLPTTVPGPSEGEYLQDAAGMGKAEDEVVRLLDLQDESRRVVVIYGVGGIGKTTLATSVIKGLNLTGYHYCRVDIDQDSKQSDLQLKQEQILSELSKENLKLNNLTEGREKLREALGKASKPVFLFIDNALRQTELEMLLPMEYLSGLPMLSRILVTTRNLNESNIFLLHDDIQFYCHRVDPLSEPEAKRLLCHYAFGDRNGSFDPGVDMDSLLQICGGIPLLLSIVGSKLRSEGNIVSACNDILKYLKDWQQIGFEPGKEVQKGFKGKEKQKGFEGTEEQKGFSEGKQDLTTFNVDFVYKQLRKPSQEAYLDIAFFFYDWERSKVSDIVGERELGDLEGAALVATSEDDKVKMHDIVRARARELSEGNRITDRESLSIILGDPQKNQQVKGIWIPNDDNELSLEAKQLDLMSKTLRVLSLGKNVKLRGRCNRAFEELRFLHISYADILSIDPRESRQLAFFGAQVNYKSSHILHLPESLRLLYLDGGRYSFVWLNIKANLTSLRELELIGIDFQNFKNIIHEYFSCLNTLKLEINILERLPESFGNLSSLQTLNLRSCFKLKELPESFGNLSSLQTLSMDSCGNLKGLPESFGNLSFLQTLSIDSCYDLKGLPESFGNLSSLQTLTLRGCSHLKGLPESFGNLSSLQTLKMDSCRDLERLPESFGNLSSLQTLSMVYCKKMCILSDNFGQLKCLKHLSIRNCKKLHRLPDDILRSTTLVAIKAYGCVELEAKAMDSLVEITSLMFLEMGESPMLIKRWEEIHRHRPPIAAVLRFESGNYPYGEIMSTMFFSARSTFLQIDGDGQLAEVALSEVGVKVGLLLTACPPSDELRRTITEVASKGFQIIYVHVDGERKTEGSRWMEEREKRIREILLQLPEGSRAWTSPFNKANLLFAYSLWEATGRVDACVVGTSVVVDEEGRRKLSHPFEMIFKIGSWDSRVELRTLFSPLSEAMEWMQSRPWEISAVSRLPEIGITDEGSEWNSAQREAKRISFHSSASHDTDSELVESKSVSYKPHRTPQSSGAEEATSVNRFELAKHEEIN